MLLQRAVAAEADELIRERVAERHTPSPRQAVAARHHRDQAIDAERKHFKIAQINRVGDDPRIRKALGDGVHDLMAEPLLEIDVNVGVLDQERGQRLGQEFDQG